MIRLGIPSKGRLMGQTFDWFSERGINLVRSESDREYACLLYTSPSPRD